MTSHVDIDEVLDNAKLRAVHIRALAVCTVAMMIDGYGYDIGLTALRQYFF